VGTGFAHSVTISILQAARCAENAILQNHIFSERGDRTGEDSKHNDARIYRQQVAKDVSDTSIQVGGEGLFIIDGYFGFVFAFCSVFMGGGCLGEREVCCCTKNTFPCSPNNSSTCTRYSLCGLQKFEDRLHLAERPKCGSVKEAMNTMETNNSNVWSTLPLELMEMIWLFLPFPEMFFLSEVCRSWQGILSPHNERFWSLVHQRFVKSKYHHYFDPLLEGSLVDQEGQLLFLGLMI